MHSTVTLSATRRQVEAKQMEAYTKEADAIVQAATEGGGEFLLADDLVEDPKDVVDPKNDGSFEEEDVVTMYENDGLSQENDEMYEEMKLLASENEQLKADLDEMNDFFDFFFEDMEDALAEERQAQPWSIGFDPASPEGVLGKVSLHPHAIPPHSDNGFCTESCNLTAIAGTYRQRPSLTVCLASPTRTRRPLRALARARTLASDDRRLPTDACRLCSRATWPPR